MYYCLVIEGLCQCTVCALCVLFSCISTCMFVENDVASFLMAHGVVCIVILISLFSRGNKSVLFVLRENSWLLPVESIRVCGRLAEIN